MNRLVAIMSRLQGKGYLPASRSPRTILITAGVTLFLLLAAAGALLERMENRSRVEPRTVARPAPTEPNPINTPTHSPSPQRPTTPEELAQSLRTVLTPDVKGDVVEMDGWVMGAATVPDNVERFQKAKAQKLARDFIFAAYASGVPIEGANIIISRPDGTLGLTVTLGAKAAALVQPKSTWTDPNIGPTIFMNFIRAAARTHSRAEGEDVAVIGGPWSE